MSTPESGRTRVRLSFAWYDLWVGAYIDRKRRTLYVCLLPCVLLTITREPVLRLTRSKPIAPIPEPTRQSADE